MKGNKTGKDMVCPVCKKVFNDEPAISRKDNRTLICPDCGTREALEGLGVSSEEQERIIQAIHGVKRQHNED